MRNDTKKTEKHSYKNSTNCSPKLKYIIQRIRYSMDLSLDKFFTVIRNGAWHSLNELSDQLGIPEEKISEFSKVLVEHGLLKQDEKTDKIRIDPVWKLLLPEEDKLPEPKTTLATFIIPPESSIDIQSTHISNVSNVEIEVSLRIDSKIKEVAISV